ncbi:MAG: hypothetical protein H2045_09575 [Rhizobiales bacterium]|nr:hypothetical protein [Hyphomicrobiales bacterium]
MNKKSFFTGLIEARQRQANRYINGYLLTLDDATLTSRGYNRKDLLKKDSASFPV